MNIKGYAKKEIALHQIETALRLFFEQGDLFSVITLAGAAEEILGHLLQDRGADPGNPGLFGSILSILHPWNRKSSESEGFRGHEADAFVHMDLYQEAVFLLGRAIDDYHALSGDLGAGMLRFNEEVRGKTK